MSPQVAPTPQSFFAPRLSLALFNMQLTLFASIILLCNSVLAAPPQRRDNTMVRIDVHNFVSVENVPVDVNILKKEDALVDFGVLRARGGSSDGTVIINPADLNDVLNNVTVEVASPS
ncbi:hypothetical protein AZE42_04314 [Rhizopogon vesiculosus]|uniref:Uncharacterized protein n=1 Tax=Rhizopogon vesiculosus TaxID=180088 RepID=A0A1J8QK23_9AGAM|nr:hypothetical protein AZE42_04314 [Rhizopogon vesiculosus]